MSRRSLQDLISGGVLPVGAELFHEGRLRPDRTVTAFVRPGGIEVNGHLYSSPSAAARAVTGTAAENGWAWWRDRRSGRPIGELRTAS